MKGAIRVGVRKRIKEVTGDLDKEKELAVVRRHLAYGKVMRRKTVCLHASSLAKNNANSSELKNVWNTSEFE